MVKKTIQWKILNNLFKNRDYVSVEDIKKTTELSKTQIYRAITHLVHRGLVVRKRLAIPQIGYKSPPVQRIEIKTNDKMNWRIRTLLKTTRREEGGEIKMLQKQKEEKPW